MAKYVRRWWMQELWRIATNARNYNSDCSTRIKSIDKRGAILYAEQKRDVFIVLLPRLTNGIKSYAKLNKTLYGLPDSPQAFYDNISIYLPQNGYK